MCVCCREIADDARNVRFELTIIDWYDGPSSGVFVCLKCNTPFRAFLIDWNPDHSERVFALCPFKSNVDINALSELLDQYRIIGENECQPTGCELLGQYDEPGIAVGWLNSTNQFFSCIRIMPELVELAKTWLLFGDSTKSEYDWHSKLFSKSNATTTGQNDEPESR